MCIWGGRVTTAQTLTLHTYKVSLMTSKREAKEDLVHDVKRIRWRNALNSLFKPYRNRVCIDLLCLLSSFHPQALAIAKSCAVTDTHLAKHNESFFSKNNFLVHLHFNKQTSKRIKGEENVYLI